MFTIFSMAHKASAMLLPCSYNSAMIVATFAERISKTSETVGTPGHQNIPVMKLSFLPVARS